MKDYLVTIREIRKIDMVVSGKTKEEAVDKVKDLIYKCLIYDISLDKIFDEKPSYTFSAKKYTEKENSNV